MPNASWKIEGGRILAREPVDMLIRNGIVVTLDRERRILKDGAIAVNESRIKDVGRTDQIAEKYRSDSIIDAKGKVVLPGLIDTHGHYDNRFCGTLFYGEAHYLEAGVMGWRVLAPLSDALDEEAAYRAALIMFLSQIRSGTTCYGEMGAARPDAVGKAAEEIGIRCYLSRSTADEIGGLFSHMKRTDTEQALRENEAFVKRWNGAADGRIKASLGPHSAINCSQELLMGIREMANEFNVGIQIHVGMGSGEVHFVVGKYGKRPVEFLHDIGLLGPDVGAVHAVILSPKDVRMLVEHDVRISHNPYACLCEHHGIPNIPSYIAQGLSVALGSDSLITDVFYLMNLTAAVQNGYWGRWAQNPYIITSEEILEMATINGARFCQWENEIGSIEMGKKADLILVDSNKPHLIPSWDIVTELTTRALGSDVDTVIIDGKIVMENREVRTVNEGEVLEKARELAREVQPKAELLKKSPLNRWKVL